MRWIRLTAAALVIAVVAVLGAADRATATAQTEFIAKLVPAAQETQRSTGIPASVSIGMAALESGWGRSSMAGQVVVDKGLPTEKTYEANTLFNIKCTKTVSPYQTGCVPIRTAEYHPDGTKYYTTAQFRTYANWGDSLRDYARLLTSNSRYAKAFDYKAYPDQFVTEVRNGGYATDPRYTELVISIMKNYNLYQYNTNGAGPGFPSGFEETPGPTEPLLTFDPSVAFPALLTGSRSDAVRTLQTVLNIRGANLTVDGSYGNLTRDAVVKFQTAQGLSASGAMDDATWAKLLPALRQGDSSPAVTLLQSRLVAKGQTVAVTGTFDAATMEAVLRFQTANRLEETGQATLVTWARLLA